MNKKTSFIFTVSWILVTRAYDVYCTYKWTPDLKLEANPLVSLFGLGWTPLLIIISILGIYCLYAYYFSCFKDFDPFPIKKDYNFSNFIGYIYTGKKQSWISVLYKFPKDINRFHYYMGNLMSRCLVFAGLISTSMWLFLNQVAYYRNIHSAKMIYLILFFGCILIIYNWFLKLYKEYIG